MIRRTISALPAVALGVAFLVEPCLAAADTSPNPKTPPKTPPKKPVPQIQQPSTPSTPSKRRTLKYKSLDGYHPHAKGSKSKPHSTT